MGPGSIRGGWVGRMVGRTAAKEGDQENQDKVRRNQPPMKGGADLLNDILAQRAIDEPFEPEAQNRQHQDAAPKGEAVER